MMDDDMQSMGNEEDDMMMTAKVGQSFQGEIVIEVIEANGLTNKEESQLIGDVSDPYCAIFLDGMEENRTKTVTNSLNPKWEEKFTLVLNGKYENLYIHIYDYDPKKSISDHLGLAQLDLKSLVDEKKRDLWIPLQQNTTSKGNTKKDKVTGNLHVKVQYLANGGEEKRRAEQEHSNAEKELEELKKQLEETRLKSKSSEENERLKYEEELKEKELKFQELQSKEQELRKKSEEEKEKLIQIFNQQKEEEAKRTQHILKEKEEAEQRLKEAMELIEKIKKEISEKNVKEKQLIEEIQLEKEKEMKLRAEKLQESTKTNVTQMPVVNFGGDFKPVEMAQPTKLFASDLCNIAAAGNTIYALKTNGSIVAITKTGISSSVPGRLTNIGVGSDGTFMGTDQSMGIWKWTGSTWLKLGGMLTMLSVGDKDSIWGVGYGGNVWKYDNGGQRWTQMPGHMRWISVGGDGEVWAVSVGGDVFRWENDSWRAASLSNVSVVTVSTKENIWAITEDGILHQFQGSSWKKFSEWGSFRFVDIAEDSLFVIDSQNNCYSSELKKYVPLIDKIVLPKNPVPGKLKSLDIGGSILGGVDPEGRIWYKNFTDNNWVNLPGLLSNISVGQDDDIWGCTTTKQLFNWKKDRSQWVFSGNLVSVSVGNSTTLAGVGDGESLWRCIGGRWEKLPGAGNQIAIGSDGELWVKNNAGNVYRWVNNNWVYIPSPPASFVSVGSTNNVVIQNAQDKALYFFDGSTWIPINNSSTANYKSFSLNANGVTFALSEAGEIFTSL